MKSILFSLLVLFSFHFAFGQDLVYLKSGEKKLVKIIEITDDFLKYKDTDNLNGPIRNLLLSDVYMVKYENGKEEVFTTKSKEDNYSVPANEIDNTENQDSYSRTNNNFYPIAFGLGFGQSYGGLGVKLHGRFGEIAGVGYHIGGGYFPKFSTIGNSAAFWYSVGLKFFFYKGAFINLQYGSVAQVFKRIYYPNTPYYLDYKWVTASGPSLLIGSDWFFSQYVGLNLAAGYCKNITQKEIIDPRTYNTVTKFGAATFDLGLIFKFQ